MSADGRNPGGRGDQSPADRCPEAVLEWIPGYVDGVLSEDARRQVEAHVTVCTECRREIDLMVGAPVELDVELPDPGRVFDEILARIEALAAEPGPRARPARSEDDRGRDARPSVEDWSVADRARFRDWLVAPGAFGDGDGDEAQARFGRDAARFSSAGARGVWGLGNSRSWRIAAALFLLMLGGAGGAILSASLLPEPSGDEAEVIYRTATEAGSMARFRDGALDVVFREGSTALEIRRALRGLDAEIVAGPSSMGVYRIRVREPFKDVRGADRADPGRAGAGETLAASAEEEPGRDWLRIVADGLVAPGSGVAVFAEPRP